MATNKYIIGSNIKFVRGRGELVQVAPAATHYKGSDADKFISNRKDLCKYRVKRTNTCKKKDYVIGQLMYIVGNDDNIVVNVDAAKQFSSFDEASIFIMNNRSLVNKLEMPYVYDICFNKIKEVSDILKTIPKELDPPLENVVQPARQSSVARITLTPTQRAKIYNKSNKTCAICGKPLSIDDFTVDHIIPLSLGGTYDEDNLQATHEKCNFMKGNLDPAEFKNLTQDIVEYQMINNFDYNRMLSMSRIMVRGTIKSFGGF